MNSSHRPPIESTVNTPPDFFPILIQAWHDFIANPSGETKGTLELLLASDELKKICQYLEKSIMESSKLRAVNLIIAFAQLSLLHHEKMQTSKDRLLTQLLKIRNNLFENHDEIGKLKHIYFQFIFEVFIQNANGQNISTSTLKTEREYRIIAHIQPLVGFMESLNPQYLGKNPEISFDELAVIGAIEFDPNYTSCLKIFSIDSYLPYPTYIGCKIGTALMERACGHAIELKLPLELDAKRALPDYDSLPFFLSFFKRKYKRLEIDIKQQCYKRTTSTGKNVSWDSLQISLDQLEGRWKETTPTVSADDLYSFLLRGTLIEMHEEKQADETHYVVFQSIEQLNDMVTLLDIALTQDEKLSQLFKHEKIDALIAIKIENPEVIEKLKKSQEPYHSYSNPKARKTSDDDILNFLQEHGTLRKNSPSSKPASAYIEFKSLAECDTAMSLLALRPHKNVFAFKKSVNPTEIEIFHPALIKSMSSDNSFIFNFLKEHGFLLQYTDGSKKYIQFDSVENYEKAARLLEDRSFQKIFKFKDYSPKILEIMHPALIRRLAFHPTEQMCIDFLKNHGVLIEFTNRPGRPYLRFPCVYTRNKAANMLDNCASNKVFEHRLSSYEDLIEIKSQTLANLMEPLPTKIITLGPDLSFYSTETHHKNLNILFRAAENPASKNLHEILELKPSSEETGTSKHKLTSPQ